IQWKRLAVQQKLPQRARKKTALQWRSEYLAGESDKQSATRAFGQLPAFVHEDDLITSAARSNSQQLRVKVLAMRGFVRQKRVATIDRRIRKAYGSPRLHARSDRCR